jgi:hypothetical protein
MFDMIELLLLQLLYTNYTIKTTAVRIHALTVFSRKQRNRFGAASLPHALVVLFFGYTYGDSKTDEWGK